MAILRLLHDDHDHGELTASRIGNVIGAAAAIAAVTLLGLKLPSLIARWGAASSKTSLKTRALIETLLTAFAAGSFWGLAIMHMLLEAVTAFARLEWGIKIGHTGDDHLHHELLPLAKRVISPFHVGDHDDDHDDYSFFNPAYIFCVGGYLLMLAIQNGAVVLNNKNKLKKGHKTSNGSENADAVISCIALTLHALFEGLVVGLADATTLVWVAAVAVIGHKWAESFALAQSMRTRACSNALRLTLLTIFFFASPVGVICGLFIASFTEGVAVASITAVSAGILIFVAGHCTEDVFGGHCHSHVEAAEIPAIAGEDSDHSSHNGVADLENQPHRDAHTHGHGPSHCHDESSGDFSASMGVFCGRIFLMTAGAGLVLGMMCLHMINPGHTH